MAPRRTGKKKKTDKPIKQKFDEESEDRHGSDDQRGSEDEPEGPKITQEEENDESGLLDE